MARKRRGFEWRVSINGIFYAVQSIGVSARVADIMVSNTEGTPGNPLQAAMPGTVARIPDLPDGEFTLESATFDDSDNPFATPIDLFLGEYYFLSGYPAGLAEAQLVYSWGNCMFMSFDHRARIPGPQPLSLRFAPDGIDVLTMLGGGGSGSSGRTFSLETL